jgi:hypothetical protein
LTNKSNDGGDQNPLKGKLEWSHKIRAKIKRQSTQQEVEKLVHKDEVFLEDVDMDVDIEIIEFPNDEQILQESREVVTPLFPPT